MARSVLLETFDLPTPVDHFAGTAQAEIEELRLAAYEQGYSAGWDDAVTAQNDEVARLRADLGRNLLDMSVSYRDARRHVLAALEPLLHDMIAKVLPTLAHQSLGEIILEQLRPVSEAMSAAPIIVKTSAANRDAVERLLAGEPGLPIKVLAEPTLSEGQAYLKLAESEVRVDLDRVIAAIASAVTAFFQIEREEEQQHD